MWIYIVNIVNLYYKIDNLYNFVEIQGRLWNKPRTWRLKFKLWNNKRSGIYGMVPYTVQRTEFYSLPSKRGQLIFRVLYGVSSMLYTRKLSYPLLLRRTLYGCCLPIPIYLNSQAHIMLLVTRLGVFRLFRGILSPIRHC